jgi:hypothetical protein
MRVQHKYHTKEGILLYTQTYMYLNNNNNNMCRSRYIYIYIFSDYGCLFYIGAKRLCNAYVNIYFH